MMLMMFCCERETMGIGDSERRWESGEDRQGDRGIIGDGMLRCCLLLSSSVFCLEPS